MTHNHYEINRFEGVFLPIHKRGYKYLSGYQF